MTFFYKLGGSKSGIPSVLENKDRILHTTKTKDQPITTVKGDYGQGTPADQQFYTTRGTSSTDAQKKN